MKPNWIKWREGDKVPGNVLVFVVRQYRKEFISPEGEAHPILIAGCSNPSGRGTGWGCRLGRTDRWDEFACHVTNLYDGSRVTSALFNPETDVLYYTEDTFLDVPDIDEGREVHISFDEILYRRGAPNVWQGRVTNKERE